MKIVVGAPNWIGDAVMSLPALDSLKALYPNAEITVLVKEGPAPVFVNKESVSDIFICDANGAHKGLNGRMALAAELRERGFDMAVLFQNAFSAALIAYLARIEKRVGYARDLRTVFLTDPVKVTDEIKKQHQILYYKNIIDSLSAHAPGVYPTQIPLPEITLSGGEREWAGKYLKGLGIEAGSALIGVSPGASYGPAKRWAPENYATVLEGFAKATGAVPLILGGPGDAAVASRLSDALGVKHRNLAGKITLRQFISVASRLDLFVTNDSGPMHIAAALGTSTLAIFGSTSVVHTGPVGARVKVVSEPIDCSPCFERECTKGHYECLTAITPSRVLSEALALAGVEPGVDQAPAEEKLRAGR